MKKSSYLSRCAMIAGAYVVLTFAFPALSYGPVQVRLSEALCVLPFFMGEAVCGLTVGCFLANLIGASIGLTLPWDILVGTIATFASVILASKIKNKWLVPLPTIIINSVFIGAMLTYVIMAGVSAVPLWYNIITVGIGEIIACYALGLPLLAVLEKIF